MVTIFYLQFVYLAVCLSIGTVEIYLFVSYKTSKPAVFTTLSDMVSCDLSIAFLTSLYLVAASYLVPSAKNEIRPILAYIIAPTATCMSLIVVLYLFSKCLVEYFQLRLRVVDLARSSRVPARRFTAFHKTCNCSCGNVFHNLDTCHFRCINFIQFYD